jgi:hypothetical protein
VKIENNLFAENKIAAVEFYANGYKQFPNRIIGNLFIHNHRDSKYLFCPVAQPEKGIAAGHCPGGQLVIARSKHVYIEENVIRDGKIDAIDPSKGTTYHSQGLLATGIELSDSIENITIKNNKIYNNSGAAIFADYVGEKYKVNNVNIFWNMVYGNGLKFGGQGYPNLEKAPYGFSFINNIGERADIPFKEAFIFADPPVCVPETNNGQCASTIQWYTNDYSNVNVRLPDNPELLLASGINNKTNVPWISAVGAKFALEEPLSKKIIDTTYAKAESSVVQSPTSAPATPAPRAKVILKAEPTTCTLNATGLCTIRISWDSSAYRSEIDPVTPLKISVRENPGSVFANSAEGAQDAPWIGINGVTFDVYYKDKLIDSLFVKGVNP